MGGTQWTTIMIMWTQLVQDVEVVPSNLSNWCYSGIIKFSGFVQSPHNAPWMVLIKQKD